MAPHLPLLLFSGWYHLLLPPDLPGLGMCHPGAHPSSQAVPWKLMPGALGAGQVPGLLPWRLLALCLALAGVRQGEDRWSSLPIHLKEPG